MDPIKTKNSNMVYKGPTPTIMDLPCERMEVQSGGMDGTGGIMSVWELTDAERQAIANGANIKLGIYGVEPIPPVSLEVTSEQREGDM